MKISDHCFILLITFCCLIGCAAPTDHEQSDYLPHVGDSAFDPAIDDEDFKICHDDLVVQYYSFSSAIQYEGEKYAIAEAFKQGVKRDKKEGENGFITIRFIVNCEGNTGRFRVEQLGMDYQYKKFNKELVSQILSVTKSLQGWKTGKSETHVYDYYQYLTFKLENGIITKIAP